MALWASGGKTMRNVDASELVKGESVGSAGPSLLRSLYLSLSLRRFAATYFAQLDAEYEALCSEDYKLSTQALVSEFRRTNERYASWVLNHRYEYVLARGLPDAIAGQREGLYLERLFALVGEEWKGVIEGVFAKRPRAGEERAFLLGLLSEIQRLRHVRTEFERLRNRLIAVFLAPIVLVMVPIVVPIQGPWMPWAHIDSWPLRSQVALAGLFGGYLSLLLRLGSLQWCVKYAANYHQVDKVFWNILWTFCLCLLEGAFGAVVLWLAFSSGAISGDLFPSAQPVTEVAKDATHLLVSPERAKLLLWSVAAGFSERLVPDFLGSLKKEVASRDRVSDAANGERVAI
jgi:hypothetical protein